MVPPSKPNLYYGRFDCKLVLEPNRFVPTRKVFSFQFSVIRKNLGFTQLSAKTGKFATSMPHRACETAPDGIGRAKPHLTASGVRNRT
jgi:hypothetical protein